MVVGGRELIDTLWNVNQEGEKYIKVFARINRYIMECKSACATDSIIFTLELIDTLWNVNTSAAEEPSGDAQELIDTLWNVNCTSVRRSRNFCGGINRYIMECKSQVL